MIKSPLPQIFLEEFFISLDQRALKMLTNFQLFIIHYYIDAYEINILIKLADNGL